MQYAEHIEAGRQLKQIRALLLKNCESGIVNFCNSAIFDTIFVTVVLAIPISPAIRSCVQHLRYKTKEKHRLNAKKQNEETTT